MHRPAHAICLSRSLTSVCWRLLARGDGNATTYNRNSWLLNKVAESLNIFCCYRCLYYYYYYYFICVLHEWGLSYFFSMNNRGIDHHTFHTDSPSFEFLEPLGGLHASIRRLLVGVLWKFSPVRFDRAVKNSTLSILLLSMKNK